MQPSPTNIRKTRRHIRSKEIFLQMREAEAAEKSEARRNMRPWSGKCEPDFEVETPWDGKV